MLLPSTVYCECVCSVYAHLPTMKGPRRTTAYLFVINSQGHTHCPRRPLYHSTTTCHHGGITPARTLATTHTTVTPLYALPLFTLRSSLYSQTAVCLLMAASSRSRSQRYCCYAPVTAQIRCHGYVPPDRTPSSTPPSTHPPPPHPR